jgi:ABC-type glycerol-3-phosphate transport system substrate-binding protein
MRQGRLVALPMTITADGLTYNKEMFAAAGLDPAKPPATWAEFLADAKKLTQAPKQYGYSLFGAKSASSARRWMRLFWDAGCEVITRDFKRAAMMDKPECIAAFKREIDFARVDHIIPPGAVNADFNFIMTGFAQSRIAMMLGGGNNADIAEGMTPGMKAKMAMAPMPDHGTSIAGGDIVVIPNGAKHPLEAARWLAYLNSRETQVESALATRLTPSRHDAVADPRIQADPFLAFHVPDEAMHAAYLTPKWPQVENAMMDMVQSALLGDETPEEAMRTATRKIDAILAAP